MASVITGTQALVLCAALAALAAVQGAPAGAAGTPSISVDKTSGLVSKDWVTVAFSAALPPAERAGCMIGLYRATANVSAITPPAGAQMYTDMPLTQDGAIKVIACVTADAGYNATGAGTHRFRVLNVRGPLKFVLFSGGMRAPRALAATAPLAFADYNVPMHGHIARTQRADGMMVMWASAQPEAATVRWGFAPGQYTAEQTATTTSYSRTDFCGAPANANGFFDPGFFHHAPISGLVPGSGRRVYYSFGGPGGWSPERSFVTPRSLGPGSGETYLLVVADVGAEFPDSSHQHWSLPVSESQANLTFAHISAAPQADAVLHIGDIAYATGWLAKWELFMTQIEEVASRTPYMTAMGNHERDWPGTGSTGGQDSGGECGVATEHRFVMPTPAHQQEAGWYSFDVGTVHVVQMFTEVECGRGSDQFAFLDADLGAVDRRATPWVVVTGHRPMYFTQAAGGAGPDPAFCMGGGDVEALFAKHKVDLALWGHVHNAIVTCPVHNGTCVTQRAADGYDATVHAVVGNGGQTLSGCPSAPPAWQAWCGNYWGWNALRAPNATHLSLELRDNPTNQLQRSLDLTRAYPRLP